MARRRSSSARKTGTSPPSSLPPQPAAAAMTGRMGAYQRRAMRKDRGAWPASTARAMTLVDSAMYRPRSVSRRRRRATSVRRV